MAGPALAERARIARSEHTARDLGIQEGKRKASDLRDSLTALYDRMPKREDHVFMHYYRDGYKHLVFYVPAEVDEEEPTKVQIQDGAGVGRSGLQIDVGNETLHVWDGYPRPLVSRGNPANSGGSIEPALGSDLDEYIELVNHIRDLGLNPYTPYEKPTDVNPA